MHAAHELSMHVCVYVKHVCMSVEHACMYVKLSSKGVGPIPYEKRSVFERQFNFLRFVRGGTSRGPNIHTCSTYIHTYMLRHTYVCIVCMSEVSKHVCMSPSMYVCLRP